MQRVLPHVGGGGATCASAIDPSSAWRTVWEPRMGAWRPGAKWGACTKHCATDTTPWGWRPPKHTGAPNAEAVRRFCAHHNEHAFSPPGHPAGGAQANVPGTQACARPGTSANMQPRKPSNENRCVTTPPPTPLAGKRGDSARFGSERGGRVSQPSLWAAHQAQIAPSPPAEEIIGVNTGRRSPKTPNPVAQPERTC